MAKISRRSFWDRWWGMVCISHERIRRRKHELQWCRRRGPCFGWIDSTIKHTDELHRAQRFTPRKKGSPYSQPNIERLIWLESQRKIHPKIRESVLPIITAPFVFPKDILDELRKDESVWENYQKFSEPYKRIRVAYVDGARKRPDEFQKRLKSFIDKTRQNKIIRGFGGIEKYYWKRKCYPFNRNC